jgi:hypothetical protein
MTPRELWERLTGLRRNRDLDREMEEEIASHLELAQADNLRAGVTPEEARRLAAVRFGSITSAKEGVWDQRGLPAVSSFVSDLRYAARGMRKSPGFTLVSVLTVAMGIGLCSAVFNALGYFFLRPVPGVPEPARLASLQAPVTYPEFEKYRDRNSGAFAAAAYIGPVPFGIAMEQADRANGERVYGQLVSSEYFATLGVKPLVGRFFDSSLDPPGAAPSAVVSERFWRTHLGADPHVAGKTLRVHGRRATIVGVGPEHFFGLFPSPNASDIFVPVTADSAVAPELGDDLLHRTANPAVMILLRLAPGVSVARAEAQLDAQTRQWRSPSERDKMTRLVRLINAGGLFPIPPEALALIVIFDGFLATLIVSVPAWPAAVSDSCPLSPSLAPISPPR